MARALHAWAINRRGKNSVRNLRYRPRTRLVRGIYFVSVLSYAVAVDPKLKRHELKSGRQRETRRSANKTITVTRNGWITNIKQL